VLLLGIGAGRQADAAVVEIRAAVSGVCAPIGDGALSFAAKRPRMWQVRMRNSIITGV
jgi:hypothetical protein